MTSELNVAKMERWALATGSATHAVHSLKRLKDERSIPGTRQVLVAAARLHRVGKSICRSSLPRLSIGPSVTSVGGQMVTFAS